jgi:hypothetical protein
MFQLMPCSPADPRHGTMYRPDSFIAFSSRVKVVLGTMAAVWQARSVTGGGVCHAPHGRGRPR